MKKILSVALVLVMLLSVFSITASAEAVVYSGYYDAEIDDLYYYLYEDGEYSEAYVVGYELDTSNNFAPAGALTIPEAVTYRGDTYTVTAIDVGAFYQSLFTSITLPSTISYIADGAFMSSDYLAQVNIPDACYFNYFGDMVFMGTPFEAEIYSKDETLFGQNVLFSYIGNAEEYVIPENVDLIAPNAFFMSGVKSVVINENITEIPYCAFASCRNLTSVTLSDSVEYISEGAFKDCTSLETFTLTDNVTSLGVDCFANSGLKSIHLGQAAYSIAGAFRGCNSLETITIDEENTALLTDGNAIYFRTTFIFDMFDSSYDLGYILAYYLPSKAQGTVTLIDEVSMIDVYAFYGCTGLKEVNAGSLMAIYTDAFANSGIEKINATSIDWVYDGAFKNCKNLTDIDLSTTDYIGIGAFENCTALTDVKFKSSITDIGAKAFANTGLTEVVIYGEDCYIEEGAFMNCENLKSVRLEEGVYYIGMNAFLNCPDLETIYLSKTIKSIEDNAFNGCDNVTFEVIKGTTAHKYIKNQTDYNFEVVGNYSFFQRIIDFFRSLFGLN